MERLQSLKNQLVQNKTSKPKSPNDVVICAAFRTPLTKSKKGGLKDTKPEEMLSALFKHVIQTTKINPKEINDIVIGNVLQPGAGVFPVRMAAFLAGIPDTTTCVSTNRLCSSGLEAVSQIAAKIQAGHIDIGIGGGVENMSLYDMQSMVDPGMIAETVFDNEQARNCLIPMGQTSENVAEKYGISREIQDQFAVESHDKALKAQKEGLFKQEIVPISVTVTDKEGRQSKVLVSQDDGLRKTTVEGLAKLKPAFKKGGSTTAGNSSQVTDGAAVVLLARRSQAEKLGLPILARFVSYAVAGVPPEIMGVGPGYAIPKALEKAGLKISDIDVFEINEAFASQASWSINHLKIDKKKVNPKGGAIALGHPLGCTGARQIATLLPELRRTGGKYGVVSMCIGAGMGAAGVFELE